jgi:amidohydrolase
VHAGDAANVIPAQGSLRGTLRTRDHEVWLRSPELFDRALATVLEGTIATWEVSYRRGVPPVVNDERETALMVESVRTALGDAAVVGTEQSLGGDSFAWYLEKIPGSYARLGVHDPRTSTPRLDLHASTFDVDERAIGAGVRVLVTTALDALASTRH